MSSGLGKHGRMGSLKAVVELCVFGPSLLVTTNHTLKYQNIFKFILRLS